METKTCALCLLIKPVEQFGVRRDVPSGRQSRCTDCQKQAQKNADAKRWAKNRESLLQRRRERYHDDLEESRRRNREKAAKLRQSHPGYDIRYAASHPEYHQRHLALGRKWYQANASNKAEYNRQWAKANPERIKSHWATRRARKLQIRCENISRLFVIERDNSTCYLCGDLCPSEQIHIDHVIPLKRGGSHTYDNVRVACARCNHRKHTRLLSELGPNWLD